MRLISQQKMSMPTTVQSLFFSISASKNRKQVNGKQKLKNFVVKSKVVLLGQLF